MIAGWWTRALIVLRRVGLRRRQTIAAFAFLGFAGSAAIGLARGPLVPTVHDEFAYLLTAETFAEGRLTNPTHPKWHHFESFHIIHEPSYQAKYPPGQGLLLAAGIKFFGNPAWGVWLGAGLLAASLAWALLVWLPPAWAVLTATYMLVNLIWASYWSQSYWGGSVAAIGGALSFGAYVQLKRAPGKATGLLLGCGLGLLAVSRPFEGLIVAVVIAVGLVHEFHRRLVRRNSRRLVESLLAALLICMLVLTGLAVYNHTVTGSALRMPYQEHERQYSAAPSFLFQKPGSVPEYRHVELERYWLDYGRERHEAARSLDYVVPRLLAGLGIVTFFLGPAALGLIGIGLRHRLRLPEARTVFIALAAVSIAVALTKGIYAHYAAPALVLVVVLMGAGLGSLHRRSRRLGTLNVVPLIVLLGLSLALINTTRFLNSPPSRISGVRQIITETLTSRPGNDLIVVQYAPDHKYHEEWVYNAASIDQAPIVWARSMGADRDSELMEYFADRVPWRLLVGDSLRLESLSPAP